LLRFPHRVDALMYTQGCNALLRNFVYKAERIYLIISLMRYYCSVLRSISDTIRDAKPENEYRIT
jgi:hypothetical protein